MSTEMNKMLARRYFEDIWNANNPDAAAELLASEAMGHVAGIDVRGADALCARVGTLHAIYDAPRFRIDRQIAEGEYVLAQWTLVGTHAGEYMGASPTGKRVSVTGMNLFRIDDGRIAEIWVNSDDLGELRQLGVIST